ncbi:helix-turn-helix domain-containing protein [Sphaerisporangium fuscum]|uniref:helix-turn-helix domain-containing protein n=1 Tax=Sphaerisporangium fuscum TaxID=2835868 RepID=UPI001BDCF793|nr:helix-turn-helix domain-containing protein [Sphaerisporangium fuscum]
MAELAAERLAELLSELKRRSGRTYEALGRRTGMSRSTVHRYCRGEIVPDSYGPLERIARACGASKAELDELYRLWAQANTALPSAESLPEAEAGPGEEAVTVASPVDAGRGALTSVEIGPGRGAAQDGGPRWRGRATVRQGAGLVGTALVIVCLVVLSSSGPSRTPSEARSTGPARPVQWITGPAWSRPEAPVPSTLFGVTVNSATGTMPGFRVGAVRLWDSETRWAQVQPQRGEYDWSVLDRLVGGATGAGLPVLYVLGGTPSWASQEGPAAPYPDGSRSSPPDDLRDWDAFVRAVVQRYRGRIEAYELWVLANDHRFYTGSVEKLVEMTRRASRIIRSADPKATVVCPGMGQLWTPEGKRVLRRFAELGGYGHCDVASIKLYQRSASDPPETMLELATAVDRTMHEAGVQPRLWNTGTTYSIPLETPLDETRARDYAVRFYLAGLYARDVNLERMYFYNWGGTKIPIVLQADGGAPTRAALAVEQLERWLAHAAGRSCGRGLAISLPENVWQCEFVVTESGRRHTTRIRWTISGTAETTAGPRARAVHRLDGGSTPVRPGDPITVTEEPIMIEDDT